MQEPPADESTFTASNPAAPPALPSDGEPSPRPEPIYAPAMRELLDWLCRSRKRLLLIYLGLLAAWMTLILYNSMSLISPELFAFSELGQNSDVIGKLVRFTIFGVFFALQALFLFGGGRIRVRPGPTKWHRMIVSVVIFSALMAILCVAFIWTYFQLTGRMPTGNRPAAGIDQFDLIKLLDELDSGSFASASKSLSSGLLAIVGGLWLIWLVIGVIAMRTTDQPRGIGRLVACLLAGSWIEFAVALPVDLVTRQRDKECPCVSGSWLALIFCFPILVWSIGPAIYLLFLREKAYCERDSRHSRRVLLQKSVRDKQPGTHS